jgi:hypothetical protein
LGTGPTGPNTLAGLTDVSLAGLTAGNALVYTGTHWVNRTLAVPEASLVAGGNGVNYAFAVTAGTWLSPLTATGTVLISNNTSLLGNPWTQLSSTLVWGGVSQMFKITYDITAQTPASTDILSVALAVNNTTPVPGTIYIMDFANNSKPASGSGSASLNINTGDAVAVIINDNTTHATNFFVSRAAVSMIGSIPQ